MIQVGGAYSFNYSTNSDGRKSIVFVVVSHIGNYHMSQADPLDRPGFEVLMLEGELKLPDMTPGQPMSYISYRPGDVFSIAEGSFIARDSVRFPAEE